MSVGVTVIKGETTGRYLAMNENGLLYGSVNFEFFVFVFFNVCPYT